ncbi:serine hydrolase domain-containing protein [Pedobacter nototheniae]|uniref:serine hydrolase domain-containing protein n=1 Tax=Pedobacter nototheniae TaxID=2488994 RepID=UPI0029312BA8|nr:serine hydrolase domain-containing protein [Pedobacter nototheniae]
MYKQAILIFTLLFPTIKGMAQQTIEKSVDRLAVLLLKEQQVKGINILLIKDGNTIYNKAFGYADEQHKIAMKTDHIFRIASQTKAITSVVAMMLWEEGKFLLEDPVSKYIPAFKNVKVLDQFNQTDSSYTTIPAEREITIRDLFRHTSGISYPVFSVDERMNAIYKKAHISTGLGSRGLLKDKIELLAKQPLLHQPGKAFTYGLNTDVLGYLIEIWSGKSLNECFNEKIFKPLGMQDTYFLLPTAKADRLASVYTKTDQKLNKVSDLIYEGNNIDYPLEKGIYYSGGAGLSSTTADYAKFLHLILNKGLTKNGRLIGEKTIDLMLSNQLNEQTKINGMEVDFQFGLGVGLITPKNKYIHPLSVGSFYWGGAFNSHYWVDPQENLIGIIMTQEYQPASFWDLGNLFQNVVYSNLNNQ